MTTLRLDQIADNFAALEQLIEEAGGEISPAVEEWLNEYSLAEREKADGYVFYLRQLEGQAQSLKALEDELAAKRRTAENRVRYLKDRVIAYMQARDVDELKGEIYRFKLQRNGGKAPVHLLCDPAHLPPEFQRVSVVADVEKLRVALDAAVPGIERIAVLDERGRSLRIY